MRKDFLGLLTVAMVIGLILFTGCATPNQTNQEASANASTTTTTTSLPTPTTAAATTSPSPSASASSSPSPTAATPTPSISGSIATSVQFASNPNVAKGTSLGINVISSTSGIRICSLGAVTVSVAGGTTIAASSGGSSDCYYTAYLDTSSLSLGTYDVTLKFAGDSTYQPSQSTSKITIQ